MVKANDANLTLLSDLSSMRARYVIETANWPLLAAENNFGNANELFAIGVSAARTGNAEIAERARQALGQRAQDPSRRRLAGGDRHHGTRARGADCARQRTA